MPASGAHQPAQRRVAGALLIAGPAIFLLGELISAAAWTDPAYSYTHHFISNLGVHGPSTLFGQYMYSPLAWVMNTGFFLFGITILAGVATLRDLSGRRRWATLIPASLLTFGGVLLGLYPGSGEALNNGTGEYHSMGAFAGFIGGNVLAIVLGHRRQRIGISARMGRALITVGVIGLISMVLYLGMIVAAGDNPIGIIGLIERGAVHPFLIGLLCAGASLWKRKPTDEPLAPTAIAGKTA
ncbi:DUF998 domain-containing protein [Streptomyces rugosispiralis]|uniref:DUF998 domain-containing protein n=1 Tax=Streptomyces rugosispiralis TaxID=2967341 RepID=A0ABT1VA83_9ACTN|nr:DUF998 domain-containing protein [Streptomyces rugosispiralis]MCQ8193903.1 DUF998 domain-containing protein [Streptomyces rugosispiralis]